MHYRLLGDSGIRVSELALGTMTFGTAWGWGAAADECARIVAAYADAGGNFIDTACNYTDGESEAIVGDLLQGRRDQFVLATKYTLTVDPADPNAGGNHSKSLRRIVEQSLRRLRTDYIDLLWLHMWDGLTSVEQLMQALDVQVRSGKVLHIAFSDTPAWVVSQAREVARRAGWSLPVAVQAPYSASARDIERELLPMAAAHGMAAPTWGAMDGGVLTGKYAAGGDQTRRYGNAPVSARHARIASVIGEIGREHGATAAQVCLAWVLGRRKNGWNIIPIVGARSEAQLRENLGGLEVRLDNEAIRRLDEAAEFRLGFPRSFLEDDEVIELIFGRTRALLDT
jgi:aryl-alcohol dehydrogenase-like predicted oxidoreductase